MLQHPAAAGAASVACERRFIVVSSSWRGASSDDVRLHISVAYQRIAANGLQPGASSALSACSSRYSGNPPAASALPSVEQSLHDVGMPVGHVRRVGRGPRESYRNGPRPLTLHVEPPAVVDDRHRAAPADRHVVADRRRRQRSASPERAAVDRLRRRRRRPPRGSCAAMSWCWTKAFARRARADALRVANEERHVVDLRVRRVAALADVPAPLPQACPWSDVTMTSVSSSTPSRAASPSGARTSGRTSSRGPRSWPACA